MRTTQPPRLSPFHATLAALPLVLLLFGCASGSVATGSKDAPEIHLAQQLTGSETLLFRGPVPLSYVLHIKNPLPVPVTLRRIELRTQGSGAYRLRTEALGLDRTIPPGGEETIQLSTWGRSHGGFLTNAEPVTIVGTAIFDTPQGQVARVFTEYVPQGP